MQGKAGTDSTLGGGDQHGWMRGVGAPEAWATLSCGSCYFWSGLLAPTCNSLYTRDNDME